MRYSCDLQETLDAVEALIKKHDVFEKSAATQEERFAALERLTTVSILIYVTTFPGADRQVSVQG